MKRNFKEQLLKIKLRYLKNSGLITVFFFLKKLLNYYLQKCYNKDMKKIYLFIIILFLINPSLLKASPKGYDSPVINAQIVGKETSASLYWENPQNSSFSSIIILRSTIPIEDYFTYEASAGLCDEVYRGKDEEFKDEELAVNLPYYYIIYAQDKFKNYSKAVVLKKEVKKNEDEKKNNNQYPKNLAGANAETVNTVSIHEAGIIYNYNQPAKVKQNNETKRLALFIIVKSPHDLTEKDKNAISYFIASGTPTTILLGAGERTGVLNSYLSVFNKLPRDLVEWQDIIKIANGRWPNERNLESEEKASNTYFNAIYQRKPDMDNPNDNAAVTVIAYGLRPANRNMENEKKAILIYRSIFNKDPREASDWDLVRAIAYSGAIR